MRPSGQLGPLPRPAAFRTFHALLDPCEQIGKRHLKRDGAVKLQPPLLQPAIKKKRLREAPGKPIKHARAGRKLADLCGAVEEFAAPKGFTIVREFVGHGVGRRLHEEPQVPNYRPQGKTPTLMPGMTLAIEPMVNAGVPSVRILDDGWTVITEDRKPSAHFEHTVLITSGDPEILTWRPREALPEMLGLPAW